MINNGDRYAFDARDDRLSQRLMILLELSRLVCESVGKAVMARELVNDVV